jgi:hypothetical protein
MKTLLTLLMMLALLPATAQRMVLLEEFTQASCYPCALQNPAFDALISANPDKVVAIKYHTSWPGVDPMYDFNPTPVDSRVSYYGVTGVPTARYGSAYNGPPSGIDQNDIDNWYNSMQQLFDISVIDSKDGNEVTFTVHVASHTALSAGINKVHCVLVEDPISYITAPGSNNETEFMQVMRAMLPNSAGTNIGTVTVGELNTVTFTYTIDEANIIAENLYLVVFVQTHGTKEIHGAFRAPLPIGTNRTATDCMNPPQISNTTVQDVSEPGLSDGMITAAVLGGTPPYAFAWNTGDDTQYLVNIPEGDYTITVTDDNGCAIHESFTVEAASANAIGDLSTAANHQVNPNPVVEVAVISWANPAHETFALRILDLSGAVVAEHLALTGETYELQRGNLLAGIYLYQLESSSGQLLNGKLTMK